MIEFLRKIRYRRYDLLLLAEASTFLVIFRVALACISVNRIIQWTTGQSATAANNPFAEASETTQAPRVMWAIRTVARRSPIEFVCFPQALAGYSMLRRRHIPSAIVYGISHQAGTLRAHTWLIIGNFVVLGEDFVEDFFPIAKWS